MAHQSKLKMKCMGNVFIRKSPTSGQMLIFFVGSTDHNMLQFEGELLVILILIILAGMLLKINNKYDVFYTLTRTH